MLLNDKDLVALIQPEVEKMLSADGLTHVKIDARKDHDGDPIVEILAHFPSETSRLSPEKKFELTQKIIHLLQMRDDDRFPHVLMIYDEDGLNGAPSEKPTKRKAS